MPDSTSTDAQASRDAPAFEARLCPDPMQVRRLLVSFRGALSNDLTGTRLDVVEFVCAELLNNVVEHAFGEAPCDHSDIRFQTHMVDGVFSIEIQDNGRPMPGHRVPRPSAPKVDGVELSALPEGGFGWNLVHRLARNVSYSRTEGLNRLRVQIDI